ncbi:MAG: amino acid adenylation domain-containing protein [Pseudomonadota bacterium]
MPGTPPSRAPLSESQKRFWRGHQLRPNAALYNMGWRFDLLLPIDAALFDQALRHVIGGSDILRASFGVEDGAPFQVISSQRLDISETVDLSQVGDATTQLNALIDESLQTPFDLSRSAGRHRLIKLREDHWVWLMCHHHIVCDAQSDALMFRRVSETYTALIAGEKSAIGETENYFSSPPCTNVHGSVEKMPTVSTATYPYGARRKDDAISLRVLMPLDEDVYAQLERVIQTDEFRLFTPDLSRLSVYLTAYVAYIWRVTGDDTVCIGLPAHNRLSQADRQTLGLFVEVLPFTVTVFDEDTFLDLHARVKEALGPFLRSAKPGAIAQADTRQIVAVLNFIQSSFGTFAGYEADAEWVHCGAHDPEHAFRLHVTDFKGSGKPKLCLDINDAVLEQTNASDIRLHFMSLLRAVITDAHQRVARVPLVADPAQAALITGPEEHADPNKTVLDLFRSKVAACPDAKAIRNADTAVTYAELDHRTDVIAAGLQQRGVALGDRVGVHMPRSIDCIMALIAVLKAGAAFVPIAANMPHARAAQILGEADAAAVICARATKEAFRCPTVYFDTLPQDVMPDRSEVSAQMLAYVLFTSGSTGVPKGVAVSHAAFTRYVQWAASSFASTTLAADYPFFSSISFDLTLTSLFVPLITGGAVVIYPEQSEGDLSVLDVFADDAVDVVKLTPSHLALVCQHAQPVSRIRNLVLGGENLTSALCHKARSVLSPDLRIVNEYGPTEAVVGAMKHWFDPARDTDASVQIGKPAEGMSISVRDADLNLCPKGVVGEIIIGGRLAEGYLAQTELTAQKFVDDPLCVQGRIYRTGDLGRLGEDGTFEYLGRADQQIKLGGVRFETAEITEVLSKLPNLHHVFVHASADARSEPPAPKQHCVKCGLPDTYPGAAFSSDGLCEVCREFDSYKDRAQVYFKSEEALQRCISDAGSRRTGSYTAVMMLSGGKDSTYAAYRLGMLTQDVLAVTLDNGYISDQAKANIARVAAHLGWDHRYLRTSAMNEIFVDSLNKHANVCQGCFKALYTLALRVAHAEGCPLIVTGLSRGQFFETRLTPELFRKHAPTCAELEALVSAARQTYHGEDDAVAQLLQTQDIQQGRMLEEIEILDIYRYLDVPVSEIYDFLAAQTPWKRPSDTGRSTNCLINDVGIHIHKTREGFHNYALPYSWDVRLGHKTRDQAMHELNDEIDVTLVHDILDEIGFDRHAKSAPSLTVYVAGSELSENAVWAALQTHFPREMMPKSVVILEEMPLTVNGKVDVTKLPVPRVGRAPMVFDTPPSTHMEIRLAEILVDVLAVDRISSTQNFFDMGVDSLAAIEVAMKANELGIDLRPNALFEFRTLKDLAKSVDAQGSEETSHEEIDLLVELDDADLASIARALN